MLGLRNSLAQVSLGLTATLLIAPHVVLRYGEAALRADPALQVRLGRMTLEKYGLDLAEACDGRRAALHHVRRQIPRPLTPAAKALVWMETVHGPAQAALLALAVRRRFMR